MNYGDKSELKPAAQKEDTDAVYWLKTYSGTEFTYRDINPMEAGVGYYIVQ